jgi:hypothetical protein
MKRSIIPVLLVLSVACGKAQKLREFDKIPVTRLEHLAVMSPAEVEKEVTFPLINMYEVNTLNGIINQKLMTGVPADAILPLIKISLNGIKNNWFEDKSKFIPTLEAFASYDPSIKALVDEFEINEGLKPSSLVSDDETLVVEAIKSATNPASYDSSASQLPATFQLPAFVWSGTLSNNIDGSQFVEGASLGRRIGAVKEKNEGHAFLTPSVTTSQGAQKTEAMISVKAEVKSPKKPVWGTWSSTDEIVATYDLVGEATLPACYDLTACSPIVALRLKAGADSSTYLDVLVNGKKVDAKKTVFLNRGKSDVQVKILVHGVKKAQFDHVIMEKFDLYVALVQDSTAALRRWTESYEGQLEKQIAKGSADAYIQSQLRVLEKHSKKNATNDDVISAMNAYINNNTKSVLKQQIAQKNELKALLPALDDINQALNDYKKARSLALTVDAKVLTAAGITQEEISLPESKMYLRPSFCKKVSNGLYNLNSNLDWEVGQLAGRL